MTYTFSITSKGQITIPKEFRDKLGLDSVGRATMRLNDRNEVVIARPQTIEEVRAEITQLNKTGVPARKTMTKAELAIAQQMAEEDRATHQ